jgi:hypothetical protein
MGDDETRGSCRTLVLDRIDLSRARQRENSTSTMKKLKKVDGGALVDGGCPRTIEGKRRKKKENEDLTSDLRDDARVTPRRTRTRRGVTARARHKKTNARRCAERAACAARVALGAQDRLVADPFADRAHTRNRARSGTTTRRRSLGNDHDTRRKKNTKKTGPSLRSRVSSRFSLGWSAMLIARETPPPPCRRQA